MDSHNSLNSSSFFLDTSFYLSIFSAYFFETDPCDKNSKGGDFPGGAMDKTLRSQCRGPGFNPWVRELDPTCMPQLRVLMPQLRRLPAATETQRNQIKTTTTTTKNSKGGFPGGAVVESLPANAGHKGSSPGPGRSHMPRSN